MSKCPHCNGVGKNFYFGDPFEWLDMEFRTCSWCMGRGIPTGD